MHTPRRRTIRFAIAAVVCLLLGAVTTVAFAWALSRTRFFASAPVDWISTRARTPSEGAGFLSARLFSRPGAWLWYAQALQAELPLEDTGVPAPELRVPRAIRPLLFPWLAGREPWPDWGQHALVEVHAYGWPMASLAALSRMSSTSDRTWSGILPIPSLPGTLGRVPGLPLHVLVRGFALDTALYATAWYLLLSTPLPLYRAGRRRFRVSRGMCPACAYDLKGSPSGPCPECGRAG